MHNHLVKLFPLVYILFGCGGGVGATCTEATDCASGYCYIPAQSESGSCKENKTQSIP